MLSENLKHFRKAKGLSQEELAIKLRTPGQNGTLTVGNPTP